LASSGPAKIELWIDQADGTLIGPNGEHITEEAYLYLDPPENSGMRIVMSAAELSGEISNAGLPAQKKQRRRRTGPIGRQQITETTSAPLLRSAT